MTLHQLSRLRTNLMDRLETILIHPRSTHLIDRYLEEIRELFDKSLTKNPFLEPVFLKNSLKHLVNEKVYLVLCWRDGSLQACLPYTQAFFKGSILKLPQLLHHRHCFQTTPLYSCELALKETLEFILKQTPQHLLHLPVVPLDSPFNQYLQNTACSANWHTTVFNNYERAGLAKKTNANSIRLSTKNRKKLERKRIQLNPEAPPQTICTNHRGHFSEIYLELEHRSWKGANSSSIKSNEQDTRFFETLLKEASDGFVQLHHLNLDNTPLAATCSLIHGTELFRFKTAFNESYAKHSPGAIIELDLLSHYSQQITRIDGCCSPAAENMNRLYPDRLPIASILLSSKQHFLSCRFYELIKLLQTGKRLMITPNPRL